MNEKQGIDPGRIVLDEAGRYEIDPAVLAAVSGGEKPVEVIRGTKCQMESPQTGKVIRGTTCTAK